MTVFEKLDKARIKAFQKAQNFRKKKDFELMRFYLNAYKGLSNKIDLLTIEQAQTLC